MPIVDVNEPLPQRPPVILFFGEPGTCKTSLFNSCEEPLLLDFDRGVSRSKHRAKTMVVDSWQEVMATDQKGEFTKYKTIGIDTAKAALDDFIAPYVISGDSRMGTPKYKLQLFGSIGDVFKQFINRRRSENSAIVILAHAKKDEDSKKMIPDITGQSYQLILRIADQVGYISIKNGKRVMTFEPSENVIGKNTAQIGEITIPHWEEPAFKGFGKTIVDLVSNALHSQSDQQKEALGESRQLQEHIAASVDVDDLEMLLNNVMTLPPYLSMPGINLIGDKYANHIAECNTPEELDYLLDIVNKLPDNPKNGLRAVISATAKKKKWAANKKTKKFEALKQDPPADTAKGAQPAAEESKAAAEAAVDAKPEETTTTTQTAATNE